MKNFTNRAAQLWLASIVFLILAFIPAASAQTGDTGDQAERSPEVPAAGQTAAAPAMLEIKGVKIGMTADEAIDKLGKPMSRDAAGMYFELSNGQAMQLALDDKKHVATLSMIYNGKKAGAPDFAEVFGKAVEPDENENGTIFKRVRYSDLGIWVAYSRIGDKDNPMTTVTIQKIRH